jgi:lipoyl(octanoyl) transferase
MNYLRIINDFPHNPQFNMAADLFLMRLAEQTGKAALRLYDWDPPCITLGYMQKAERVLRLDVLKQQNVGWIKRPTGGRAVFHIEDITYSFVFPTSITALGKTVSQTYSIVGACLMHGLQNTGIPCYFHDSNIELAQSKREIKLPCFLAPNRDEIMVGGKKLVGSAQKRTEKAVLQHGTIPLSPAYRTLPDFLNISLSESLRQKELLASKSICCNEIDLMLDAAEIKKALVASFCSELPLHSFEQQWSEDELQEIVTIANTLNNA